MDYIAPVRLEVVSASLSELPDKPVGLLRALAGRYVPTVGEHGQCGANDTFVRPARPGDRNEAVVCPVDDQHGRLDLVEPIDEAGAQAVPSYLASLKGAKRVPRSGLVCQSVCFLDHLVGYRSPVVKGAIQTPPNHAATTT
jgi:hypothetical protein